MTLFHAYTCYFFSFLHCHPVGALAVYVISPGDEEVWAVGLWVMITWFSSWDLARVAPQPDLDNKRPLEEVSDSLWWRWESWAVLTERPSSKGLGVCCLGRTRSMPVAFCCSVLCSLGFFRESGCPVTTDLRGLAICFRRTRCSRKRMILYVCGSKPCRKPSTTSTLESPSCSPTESTCCSLRLVRDPLVAGEGINIALRVGSVVIYCLSKLTSLVGHWRPPFLGIILYSEKIILYCWHLRKGFERSQFKFSFRNFFLKVQ